MTQRTRRGEQVAVAVVRFAEFGWSHARCAYSGAIAGDRHPMIMPCVHGAQAKLDGCKRVVCGRVWMLSCL